MLLILSSLGFLWGYVKGSVYKTRPTIIDNKGEIIVAAFRGRTPHIPFKKILLKRQLFYAVNRKGSILSI